MLEVGVKPDGKILAIDIGDPLQRVKLSELGWDVTSVNLDEIDQVVSERRAEYDAIFFPGFAAKSMDVKASLLKFSHVLKKGGRIHLSAPNAHSFGHLLFRKNWFGVEPSLNKIIMTPKAVKKLFNDTGFEPIKVKTVSCETERYMLHSMDIVINRWTSLNSSSRLGKELTPLLLQMIFGLGCLVLPGRGEECVAIAKKR